MNFDTNMDVDFKWGFPKKVKGIKYKYEDKITGEIISSRRFSCAF